VEHGGSEVEFFLFTSVFVHDDDDVSEGKESLLGYPV